MDEIYGSFTIRREIVSSNPLSEVEKAMNRFKSFSFGIEETPLDKKRRALERYEVYKDDISEARSEIYKYALNTFYQIEFSEVSNNIFDNFRINVDKKLPELLPDSKNILDVISVNIKSSNSVKIGKMLLQVVDVY